MPSVSVLEAHQKPTDKPTRRIKRSGGQSLVNRGMAYWIRENVLLQMRRSTPRQKCLNSTPHADFGRRSSVSSTTPRYIPEKLPANIDGMLGLIVQAPVLPNQIRFRHV